MSKFKTENSLDAFLIFIEIPTLPLSPQMTNFYNEINNLIPLIIIFYI